MIKFSAPEELVVRSIRPKVTEKVTEKVTDKVIEKVIENLDEKSLKILKLLVEDPGYTAVILSEKLSLSRKTISERIKKLRENKIIERVGSDRKGYWKINL